MIQIHQVGIEKRNRINAFFKKMYYLFLIFFLHQTQHTTSTLSAQVSQTLTPGRSLLHQEYSEAFMPLKGIITLRTGIPACDRSTFHATGRKAWLQIPLKATGGLSCQGFGAAPALVKKHDALYT